MDQLSSKYEKMTTYQARRMSSKNSKADSSSSSASGKLVKAFLNPFKVFYIIHLRVKNDIALYTFVKFAYAIYNVV